MFMRFQRFHGPDIAVLSPGGEHGGEKWLTDLQGVRHAQKPVKNPDAQPARGC